MRIDVHQHFAPARYITRVDELSHLSHGPTDLAKWSIDQNLRTMDAHGVDFGVASVTAPGVWIRNGDHAVELTESWNDDALELCESSGGRFGCFATLPLPDTKGSRLEIERTRPEQLVYGYSAFTNYDGVWIGDRSFDPVFQRLNDISAVLFVHPAPSFGGKSIPEFRPQILEFPFDTTRAVTNWIRSGASARFPNIRIIFAHGGGCITWLAERIDLLDEKASTENSYRTALPKFYFDTALVSSAQADAICSVVTESHVLFGSDAPFTKHLAVANAIRFGKTNLFTEHKREAS